jgi:hypothetical protein
MDNTRVNIGSFGAEPPDHWGVISPWFGVTALQWVGFRDFSFYSMEWEKKKKSLFWQKIHIKFQVNSKLKVNQSNDEMK